MKKKNVNDSNKEAPKSKGGNEKEPMVSKEMVDKEGDPKVVENDEFQSYPLPTMKVPPSFPQKLKKKEYNAKFKMFLSKLSNLSINIPLLEAIQEILGYAKLMKKLVSKKYLIDGKTIQSTDGCSAIMTSTIEENKEEPGAFTIPCTIGRHKFERALYDLGASINLMPYVDRFILPTDFIVLDCEIDQDIPIILGRRFLAIRRAIVDMELGEINFWVQDNDVSFQVYKTKIQYIELQVVSVIDLVGIKVNDGSLEDQT
ncbi:uncharacterized protein LOC124898511 [Capsicum annuum]|uniref:uncharacterized protein LOC124898511 n=1 Tax=Capsicum annuum TaxID=4072 RepID=UPI001FB124BE|nr:uncharacterized protein LOC124898511 [Capsicum annuum]